jgi:hypothetical protein
MLKVPLKLFSVCVILAFILLANGIHSAREAEKTEKKISDINVLLPVCEGQDCNKVYYTVHAQGGCYEW